MRGRCPDHWRGIFDDHGRLMVAITFQSDVGDSWEWADSPYYPGKVRRPRHPHRRELRSLRDDALRGIGGALW